TNIPSTVLTSRLQPIRAAPQEAKEPRYYWKFNQNKEYDFNNERFIVGEDGSPYGDEGVHKMVYSEDTPLGTGRSLDLGSSRGRINFCAPYTPEINWGSITMSF